MRTADYLARLDQRVTGATIATLRAVHHAHRETFLFENLTIQQGGRISLALEDLERKFIDDRRGGYCFEHNTLFAAALRDLGFDSVTLLGRVRRGPPSRWCRTHMVLRVVVAGEPWLADVGFGAMGLVEPIPMRDGATSAQAGFSYRLRRENRLWVLSATDGGGATSDCYEFTDDPQTPWDVEVANHFTATHPESIFRKSLTIQRTSGDVRTILRTDTLTTYRSGRMTDDPIARSTLPLVAREAFGVEIGGGPFVFEEAAL
jgi:N-hydroxyarylamine O-acetyltransferase